MILKPSFFTNFQHSPFINKNQQLFPYFLRSYLFTNSFLTISVIGFLKNSLPFLVKCFSTYSAVFKAFIKTLLPEVLIYFIKLSYGFFHYFIFIFHNYDYL